MLGRFRPSASAGVRTPLGQLKDRCSTSELRPHALQRNILQSRPFPTIGLYAPCTLASGNGGPGEQVGRIPQAVR